MITEDAKIAEIFNHYFANITGSLGISEDQSLLSGTNGIKDPVEKAIKKYENQPSIRKIKECYELNQFEFKPVTVNEIHLQIQKLNPKKSSTAFLLRFLNKMQTFLPSSFRKSSTLICQSATFQRS